MADLVSVHVIVYGRVKGVFFRAFTSRQATKLNLSGYVRNLPGENAVEINAEGERKQLKELIRSLKVGPLGAKVDNVISDWSKYAGNYANFDIKYD